MQRERPEKGLLLPPVLQENEEEDATGGGSSRQQKEDDERPGIAGGSRLSPEVLATAVRVFSWVEAFAIGRKKRDGSSLIPYHAPVLGNNPQPPPSSIYVSKEPPNPQTSKQQPFNDYLTGVRRNRQFATSLIAFFRKIKAAKTRYPRLIN